MLAGNLIKNYFFFRTNTTFCLNHYRQILLNTISDKLTYFFHIYFYPECGADLYKTFTSFKRIVKSNKANELLDDLIQGIPKLREDTERGDIKNQIDKMQNIGVKDLALLVDEVPENYKPVISTARDNCASTVEKLRNLKCKENDENAKKKMAQDAAALSCGLLSTNHGIISAAMEKNKS